LEINNWSTKPIALGHQLPEKHYGDGRFVNSKQQRAALVHGPNGMFS
jgi:hypothetical protein